MNSLAKSVFLLLAIVAGLARGGETFGAGVAGTADEAGGQRVEIGGGRALEMVRAGQGRPVVVLVGGSPNSMDRLQASIAAFTSVVRYSRAGYGKSDPVPSATQMPADIAHDLHQMVQNAKVPPRYVLVGYSAGALFVRAFAQLYPDDVAGLVLVDGTPVRWIKGLQEVAPKVAEDELAILKKGEATGFSNITSSPAGQAEWRGFYRVWLSGDLGVPGSIPDVPFAVITGARPDGPRPEGSKIAQLKVDLNETLIEGQRQGLHVITFKSGHDVIKNEPDLVVSVVRYVVESARTAK